MGRVFKALARASIPADEAPLRITKEEGQTASTGSTDFFEPPAAMDEVAGTFAETEPTRRPEPALPPSRENDSDLRFENKEAATHGWDERLLAASGIASAAAEELRRLRTYILHPPNGGTPPKSILVVSAVPEEGKTFICAALGIALAQGVEEHALMIDCDLRRPALARLFGLDNQTGLADYLQQGTDLGQLLRPTGFRKLSILPSGTPPFNPAELLGSERLAAMVKEVVDRYPDRYVLFDSPPLQKAAETAILAKQVEGILLVVREGRSRREEVKKLVEMVGRHKIIGVVYNDFQINPLERRMVDPYADYYSSSGLAR